MLSPNFMLHVQAANIYFIGDKSSVRTPRRSSTCQCAPESPKLQNLLAHVLFPRALSASHQTWRGREEDARPASWDEQLGASSPGVAACRTPTKPTVLCRERLRQTTRLITPNLEIVRYLFGAIENKALTSTAVPFRPSSYRMGNTAT